jgi:hypothetical protein
MEKWFPAVAEAMAAPFPSAAERGRLCHSFSRFVNEEAIPPRAVCAMVFYFNSTLTTSPSLTVALHSLRFVHSLLGRHGSMARDFISALTLLLQRAPPPRPF